MKSQPTSGGILGAMAALAAMACLSSAPVHAAATITVVNLDGPNEGFNDPNMVPPVGGNPGTTLGQQRLLAFQHAANVWGATLDSSVEIKIEAVFDPLTCTATGATLGAAGAIQIFADFPGAELDNTWYQVALANKLAGEDLAPGPSGTDADDIIAQFNSRLNGDPACLGGRKFYLGFDSNHGNDIDLVVVLLHEFGHGLGFANFVNETNGTRPGGLGDVFSEYTRDETTGKKWNDMAQGAELRASAINSSKVFWDGLNVTAAVPDVLLPGVPLLRVNSPAGIAGRYAVGTAAFGPALSSPGVTGAVVQALDDANVTGPTTFDACTAITNAGAVAGKIAMVDRGVCGFVVKVKNAQDAGAIAVLVADNAPGSPPAGMAGADPNIVIPSVRITQADGNLIKAQLASGVNATLSVDLSVRAGTNAAGFALLNAPNPVQQGSSISHWDPIAFRNLLMEPAINADLTQNLHPPLDLTYPEMVDIGWISDGDGVPDGRDECLQSDPHPTVVIDGCNSGVPNSVSVLGTSGCRISDLVAECADGAGNHNEFVSCVAHVTNRLKKAGSITGAQKGAIQSCADHADLP